MIGVTLRRGAGQAMKIGHGDAALAGRPGDMDLGVERRERHAHVGRMRRNAGLAGAENGMHAIEPGDGGAAAAGLALITGRCGVVKVIAAGALQEIAAGRGHVTQLRRGAGEEGAAQHWIALGDQGVIGEVRIRHQRADAQAAVAGLLDGLERQARNVDQPRRPLDVFLHQIDEVGAAGDEFRLGVGRDQADGVGDIIGAGVVEIYHDRPVV